jgi:hypothetical protein
MLFLRSAFVHDATLSPASAISHPTAALTIWLDHLQT